MANDISKIKLPGSTTEYTLKDGSAVANITRSGTTFTATKRDGTTFTFTQQDNNTTYTLSADTANNQIKLTPSSGSAQSITVPYATSAGSATNAYYLQDSIRTSYRLKYINTNDSTTATADTLGETTNIAITMVTPTGAPTTNHALWFNIADIGTPFQLFFPDNQLYIYKRYKTSGTWGDWTKMRAGYADSAGSATSATTASKLSTNAGSATNPVYFTGGVPTACSYSLNKTVPSNAAFTDTTYTLSADTTNNKITLTPSSGTAQSITVPFATSASDAGRFVQNLDDTLGNRQILFTETTDNAVARASARRSSKLYFNPSTGALTCTGNIYTNSEGVFGTGIELGMHTNDSLSFIDFHWNSTGTDWTARIVQRSENTVDLIGKNSSTWGIWRAASFSSQSSIHVKENVQNITAEDARRLLQLRPVTFNYKNGGQVDQAGLIAEEVNLVMPKMVIGDINFNPEEPWNAPSIDYSKFTPYLIKMVQEQQKEIDELRRLVQG